MNTAPENFDHPQCEKLAQCPFFSGRMAHMSDTAETMRQTYCLGDFARCARHVVLQNGVIPPDTLFPTDMAQALALLQDKT